MSAISVHGLGKQFRLGLKTHTTLRDQIAGWFQRSERAKPEAFWALKDINFEVQQGEVIGIIGHNGAGKSTLLKILSQITDPTEGEVRIRGRVASLLEVGTGFHPELSGRENVFLNGAILGMRRHEIRARFDQIVAFAEVERFIDTPVKHYSSGMYVRLAFAVAAHLEPETLIVDEVLAVGDASFQTKCLNKIGEISSSGGRTVLFVSHNLQAVQNLCHRAALLEHGRLTYLGETCSVVDRYLAQSSQSGARKTWSPDVAPGNDEVKLLGVRIFDSDENCSGVFRTSRSLFVELTFDCPNSITSFCAGFDISTPEGGIIFRTYQNDQSEEKWPALHQGRNVWRCELPPSLLNSGVYLLSPKLTRHTLHWILNGKPELQFEMILDHGVSPYWSGLRTRINRPGAIAPIFRWSDVTP